MNVGNGYGNRALNKLNASLGVVVTSLLLSGCITDVVPGSEVLSASGDTLSSGTIDTTVRGVSAVKNSLVTQAGEEFQGRPAFDGVALTERRDTAVSMATEQYGVEPVCEAKKVAPKNSRRADFYEYCKFAPVSKFYGEAEITSVSYHFMSSKLVQIDALLAGSALTMEPTAQSLSAILGGSDFSSATVDAELNSSHGLPQAIYHWTKTPDNAFARLRTSSGADDESFQLSIQHPMVSGVIAELPAL